jgi:hypothetical protein
MKILGYYSYGDGYHKNKNYLIASLRTGEDGWISSGLTVLNTSTAIEWGSKARSIKLERHDTARATTISSTSYIAFNVKGNIHFDVKAGPYFFFVSFSFSFSYSFSGEIYNINMIRYICIYLLVCLCICLFRCVSNCVYTLYTMYAYDIICSIISLLPTNRHTDGILVQKAYLNSQSWSFRKVSKFNSRWSWVPS